MKRLLSLALCVAVAAGCADDPAMPDTAPSPGDIAAARTIFDQFIVVLAPGLDPQGTARAIASEHGGSVVHVYEHALRGFSLRVAGSALGGIRSNPHVLFVEPDREVAALVQTLPTGIERIGADLDATAAIDGLGEPLDVDIAILDSGIDRDHPDLRLAPVFQNCIDAIDDDLYGHGTHVAGIAGALDNGEHVVGVAPGARLWPVKVLNDLGHGTLASVICGIDYVTANAAAIEVANISFGGAMQSDALRTAITNSVAAGVFYAVAAGNSRTDVFGSDGVFDTGDDIVPAAYPEVATVSAIADSDGRGGGAGGTLCSGSDLDDSLACYTNFSRSAASGTPVVSPGAAIDLAAPGTQILSTYKDGGIAFMDGTSMAAPHLAGAAALEILRRGTRDLNGDGVVDQIDVYALRQALIDAADPQKSWRADGYTEDPDGNLEGLVRLGSGASDGPAAPAPAVLPDGAVDIAAENTVSNQVLFTVENRGTTEETFALSCAVAGNVLGCTAPASVTVAAGVTAVVTVGFDAGAAGDGSLSLTASGSGGSDSGSYLVSVRAPQPTSRVAAIDVSLTSKGRDIEPTAVVTVVDGTGAIVKGATVTGDWYFNESLAQKDASGGTGGNGVARIRGPRVRASAGDVLQFCVTNVSGGPTYDSAANAETCDQAIVQ